MKDTNDLQNVVALGLVAGDSKVIAAGPITLQPHSRPYRIVMVNWGNNFSVHSEYFHVNTDEVRSENNDTDLLAACQNAETSLDGGQYFNANEFDKAVRIFGDKLEHSARFVESIYREFA